MNEINGQKIDEVFLDRILIDIQRMDQNKCLSIGKSALGFCLDYISVLE